MSTDGQGTKCSKKVTENVNRLRRVHGRYTQMNDRRQTDAPAIAYSEREREFTFEKLQFILGVKGDVSKTATIIKRQC